jgi:signal transduction histidine kinase
MRLIQKHNDDKATSILTNIRNQTNRLQKLVNDLLDVSRLQTGKLTFEKEMFRLDELVAETIEVLKGSAKRQKLIFEKTSPVSVYGDRFRIYQVITNLVTNAIKYSPDNTDIIIKVYKKNKKAEVSVQDSGIGIDKDQRKRIFERLYQVTDDKEKTFPGFGMGLYISKEIIKRHKGNIWVESEKGKGSTFYFNIPLKQKS